MLSTLSPWLIQTFEVLSISENIILLCVKLILAFPYSALPELFTIPLKLFIKSWKP